MTAAILSQRRYPSLRHAGRPLALSHVAATIQNTPSRRDNWRLADNLLLAIIDQQAVFPAVN